MYPERLPPYDQHAEEGVLGSILLDQEAILKVAANLKPEDFFLDRNRWIYEACLELYERRVAIDQNTVAHYLALKDKLEDTGGASHLNYLVSILPTPIHIEHYARIVQDTALLRRLIDSSGRIAAMAYEGGPDAEDVLDRAEDILFRLRSGRSDSHFSHIKDILDQYLEEAGTRSDETDAIRIKTGFPGLDNLLGGLQRSNLVILAARPGLGKTSLALNIAFNAAHRQNAKVAIFSLEMAKEELVERLLSSESGVDSQHIRLDRITSVEEERLIEASGELSELLIFIDDTPVTGVVEMRSKARRLHRDLGVDLIVVDYLQLIQGAGNTDNRVQQMSEISRYLKIIARELNVPVLALSQLSRAVETRTPHIPMLSDLRDSGSIEQDADVVMFIYREDAYITEEEWVDRYPTKNYPRGIADIMIAKHRNGPTGQTKLFFQNKTAKFFSMSPEREL